MSGMMRDGNGPTGSNVRIRSPMKWEAPSVPVLLIFCLDLNPTTPPSSLFGKGSWVKASAEAVSVGQRRGENRTDRGNRIGSVTGQYQLSICRD